MQEKYLPIGSVVRLKGQNRQIVIVGYTIYNNKESKTNTTIYDYCGFPYPEGYIGEDKNIAFNHELIEEIKYIGYMSENFKDLNTEIKKALENFEKKIKGD